MSDLQRRVETKVYSEEEQSSRPLAPWTPPQLILLKTPDTLMNPGTGSDGGKVSSATS